MRTRPADPTGRERWAYALLFVAPILFASNNVTARWAAGAVPPLAMAFWRWALTLLLLLPVVGPTLWRYRVRLVRESGRLLLLGALGMGVSGAPVYIGARTTAATNIGLIYAASPVLILLLDRFFGKERLRGRQVAGMTICLVGVLVILARGDPAAFGSLAFSAGDLWILLGATGWSFYSVLLKHIGSHLPWLTRFAGIVLAGVLVNLPFYVLEGVLGHPMALDARSIATVVFLALAAGLGAFLAHARLTALLGPRRTGLLLYLVPVYNAALAWLLLGEPVHLYHLAGALLVLPGVYLATTGARPR